MKRKVLLCVTALILAVVALCLVACGEQTEERVEMQHLWTYNLETNGSASVTSDLSLSDLTFDELMALYDFYHASGYSDFNETIFRDMSTASRIYDRFELRSFVENDEDSLATLKGNESSSSFRGDSMFRYQKIDGDVSQYHPAYLPLVKWEDRDVTFFDGRTTKTLADDEVVVSKYAYYTVYVNLYGLTLTADETRRIINDEDVFAKYIILRNSGPFSGFVDAVAFEYYGLTDRIENKVITLDFQTPHPVGNEVRQPDDPVQMDVTVMKKIVGYYDVDHSDLAGRKTDLNNMCGYNYDVSKAAGYYRIVLDTFEGSELKKEQNDRTLLFIYSVETFDGFDPSDETNPLWYEIDETVASARKGGTAGLLTDTMFMYGK